MNITKGVAILFMLLLHLFCTKEYSELFTPLIMIGEVPLIYYFAPKYPILIFIWLVVLCIAKSNIINIIHNPIIKFIELKLK